jgi:hypothetical protein
MSFYQEDQPTEALPVGAPFERHYYIREIARLWGFSNDMIRRIFENEPGVVRVGEMEKLHKRRYVSLRIPESVMRRVHRRLTTTTGKPI